MAVLADLERLLERVFERSTARLFRAHPQAVQLERRVERAMERARSSSGGRIMVPVRYRVRLEPDDLGAVAEAAGGADVLAGRLADSALAFARAHGYHLPERPSVALVADPAVERGVIEVDAVAPVARAVPPRDGPAPGGMPVPDMPVVGRTGGPVVAEASAAEATGRSAVGAPATGPDAMSSPDGRAPAPGAPEPIPTVDPAPIVDPAPDAPAPTPSLEPSGGRLQHGVRGDGTSTLVFRRPVPVPTRALLRLVTRAGAERTIEVDGTPLAIGRAADNGLAIQDPRVSRHHARLQARRGTLVLTDLGSTNGTRVNGVRVDECALGAGDRILIGDTVLLVEQLPD